MFSNFFKQICLSFCLLLIASLANAKDIQIKEENDKFLITKWTTEEGLPQNSVNDIVQTQDGYIWLATFGGLARFDGIKFTVFNTANTPNLTSNRILSIEEDKYGILWIATETGEIYTHQKGEFKIFRNSQETKTFPIRLYFDSEDTLWIVSENAIEKVSADESGNISTNLSEITKTEKILSVTKDPNGDLWILTKNKLFNPRTKKIKSFNGDSYVKYTITKDGKNWVLKNNGSDTSSEKLKIGYYESNIFYPLLDINIPKKRFPPDFFFAEENTVWVHYSNHLLEINHSNVIRHDVKDLTRDGTRKILRDKDNNLWIGTNTNGLIRLKPKRISLLSRITNSTQGIYSVIESSKGTIWAAAATKLFRIQNGKTDEFVVSNNPKLLTTTLALDKNDTLWYGGYNLFGFYKDGKFITFDNFQDKIVFSLFFDKKGTLWIGTNVGLFKYENDEFTQYLTQDGLVDNRVHFITQTKDDSLWIGTEGGLSCFKDGKFDNFSTKDGLSNNYIREILEDKDGTIWLGTYGGGIVRFKDEVFKTITKEKGLHDDFISRILVDGEKFWMLSNRGIFSLNRNELNEVADGTRKNLVYSVFGVADGMKTSEASGGFQYAGWKTKDGRLWFPMIDDMVIIDPKLNDKTIPKIVIENVSFRGENFDSKLLSQFLYNNKTLELDYGLENLEIEYTGLSFAKPEQIRFFYKLDGLDNEWVDAGKRRTAFYPYLPAGKYKFLVKAVSADGVSSQKEATLSINVASPFWQKWWFILLVFCASIALIIYIYQLRLKQLEKKRLRQERFSEGLINAQETERDRLASELHDGLGQNLLIIKNWALLGINNSTEEIVTKQLEEISEKATNALDETRSIVSNLRPLNLSRFGLTEAIETMIEQVQESTGIVFNKDIEDIDSLFSDKIEISIYRIVQECLNNIVKHSDSPRADISIKKSENKVNLLIKDYGKGFARNNYLDEKDAPNGFGLTSISQRIALLGGNLNIDSQIDEGTKISITLKI